MQVGAIGRTSDIQIHFCDSPSPWQRDASPVKFCRQPGLGSIGFQEFDVLIPHGLRELALHFFQLLFHLRAHVRSRPI
jgi:hypothetical protein